MKNQMTSSTLLLPKDGLNTRNNALPPPEEEAGAELSLSGDIPPSETAKVAPEPGGFCGGRGGGA